MVTEQWPFVGRKSELAQALAMINATGSAGVAVHGVAGVGRSRFVAELVAGHRSPGRRVLRAIATASTGSVPLGALAHLLPAEALLSYEHGPIDPVRFLTQAGRELVRAGAFSLVVDDAHFLDALSMTLLHQLIVDESVRVVVTVRTGDSEPDGLSALWRTDRIGRVDLAPLDTETVNGLLHLGLSGPVDGRASRLLADASGGIPLLLRELVRAALDEGVLLQADGVWCLNGPLPAARRAVELVAGRLARVPDDARRVLDLLVLVGGTPLELLDTMASDETLEALDAEDLIRVTPGALARDGHTASISNHVVAEALRAELSPMRSRNILRAHAERYAAWSSSSDADQLRIAGWRLQAGVSGDPVMLEHAATLARHAEDFVGAVAFATAADRVSATLRSAVLLSDALYELCRWKECEEVAAAAMTRPGTAADRLRLVGIRGTNLLIGLMRGAEALAVTSAALANLDAGRPEWRSDENGNDHANAAIRAELVSRVALLQMYDGYPAAAINTLGPPPAPVGPGDNDDPQVREQLRASTVWAIPAVPAIALSGRTGEAVALGYRAFAEHERLGGEVGLSSLGVHMVTIGFALQEHGEFPQAESILNVGYEAAVSSGALLGQIWFSLNLSRIGLLTSHPETARRWARQVLAATSITPWLGLRSIALCAMASASAQLDDVEGARRCLAEASAIGDGFGFLFPERAISEAWSCAAEGRLENARDLLLAGATSAAATGHLTSESWLRYEAARLGGDAGIDRMRHLAASSDSAMVQARTQYVLAMVLKDPTELHAAGEAMEALTCHVAAAELFHAAADVLRAQGRPRAAQASVLRATAAVGRSEHARSYLMSQLRSPVPLSPRERDIAGLAASGVPSKEIAQRLFLSVRTVNNHLQSAYRKLGATSRADVARMLAE